MTSQFNIVVGITGAISLGLSIYLFWFFHRSPYRMGRAVKWMLLGEIIATIAFLIFWAATEFKYAPVLDSDIQNTIRILTFMVTAGSSVHMTYQIRRIERSVRNS